MKPTMATVAAVACLLAGAAGAHATAHAAKRPAPQQVIAVLLTNHSVRDRPGAHSKVVAFINDKRPLTGERTTLPVLQQTTLNYGQSWLRVRLPGRTLGQNRPPGTGWISASNTRLMTTSWHIIVSLGARQVIVEHNGRPIRVYSAIVGKPSTPTPTGQYFVEETVHLGPNLAGGPYALATSDRSNVLQVFDGGPGQIALHGLDNLGGQLGTAESHGCVRLADNEITWLAVRIGPGTPVTIN
jgi:lipoprotein-anchoring transpeptidase ErfK/SrfK